MGEGKTTRRMPVVTREVHVEYEGVPLAFTVRRNAKVRTLDALFKAGNVDACAQALDGFVLSWDFPDEEGEPMAPPSYETLREVPHDLLQLMIEQGAATLTAETNP